MIRELLRRWFGRAGASSREPAGAAPPQEDAAPRIDAARDRLKSTIPPPEDQARPLEDRAGSAPDDQTR